MTELTEHEEHHSIPMRTSCFYLRYYNRFLFDSQGNIRRSASSVAVIARHIVNIGLTFVACEHISHNRNQ